MEEKGHLHDTRDKTNVGIQYMIKLNCAKYRSIGDASGSLSIQGPSASFSVAWPHPYSQWKVDA
jgi:hypothetical protein